MAVRTGKGDKGYTELSFRKRISKDSADIRAIGDLDELNGCLGLAKVRVKSKQDKAILEKIQQFVSMIASEIVIGTEKKKKMGHLLRKDDSEWLKNTVYRLEQEVEIENRFYVPGDNEVSAFLDITRAVARRAESSVVGLFNNDAIKNTQALVCMNCISDVLFILARKHGKKKRKRK
ncbi:MAG: cob(I)yrinic acid a,c-diamide adenosyltransferase [Candidatus Omnitrophica bacterium]|nr:cob(I)yrinic acid a,c-diamide adenosyltransferase [Candidatus Omnitrophota bacterium]